MKILLVTDSRGNGLGEYFPGGLVDVNFHGGAGVAQLFSNAKALRKKTFYDIVCVCGGICNITYRHKVTKKVNLPPEDQDHVVRRLDQLFRSGINDFQAEFPHTTVLVLPIVGVEINRYNKEAGVSAEQKRLNHMITAVNKMIVLQNDERGLPTPMTASKVHLAKGHGLWSHQYKHLSDGCHFSDVMMAEFAVQLLKTLIQHSFIHLSFSHDHNASLLPPPKIRETCSGLVFSGYTAFLSNFFSCFLLFANIWYISAEQAYQHQKALFHGKYGLARAIFRESHPVAIKRLGSQVQVCPEWLEIRGMKLASIVTCKFDQNQNLMSQLVSTYPKLLIEGTKDAFWGGGRPYDSQGYDRQEWHGCNVMGRILWDIREEQVRAIGLFN